MTTELKKETRGRKRLPPEAKKPPQATLKINAKILPFVQQLKSNLKNGTLTDKTLDKLFAVLNGSSAWEQTSVLNEQDIKEQSYLIERLQAENLELKARLSSLDNKKVTPHLCQATTKSGSRCKRQAVHMGTFGELCEVHYNLLNK